MQRRKDAEEICREKAKDTEFVTLDLQSSVISLADL